MLWAVAAAAIALRVLPILVPWLQKKAILDQPNERSSHTVPTPRGGGLAVVAAVLPLWGLVMALAPASPARGVLLVLLLGGAVLAGLSWMDDRHSLSAKKRLLVQAALVGGAMLVWPSDLTLFQGSQPLWLDRAVMALGWLWFLNLYNFMDGIDGITGVQTVSIAGGLALVALMSGLSLAPYPALAAVLAGAALGFLRWNWHPAKVFMGDVGSIPLGFWLGGLLLLVACEGAWGVALVLPGYYLADASLTLGKRWLRRENLAQAHRQHFYQVAVHGGRRTHAQVSQRVAVANTGLVVLALSLGWMPGLLVALLAVAVVMTLLRWMVTVEGKGEGG